MMYINDLFLVGNVFNMLMYVDDTTLLCNINQDIGEEVINDELVKQWDWLNANKLSLNIVKKKYHYTHGISYKQMRLCGTPANPRGAYTFYLFIIS